MKIEIELGTDELGNNVIEQIMIGKLKDICDMCRTSNWHHPDDKKQDKKIVKACKVLLKYYGEKP